MNPLKYISHGATMSEGVFLFHSSWQLHVNQTACIGRANQLFIYLNARFQDTCGPTNLSGKTKLFKRFCTFAFGSLNHITIPSIIITSFVLVGLPEVRLSNGRERKRGRPPARARSCATNRWARGWTRRCSGRALSLLLPAALSATHIDPPLSASRNVHGRSTSLPAIHYHYNSSVFNSFLSFNKLESNDISVWLFRNLSRYKYG